MIAPMTPDKASAAFAPNFPKSGAKALTLLALKGEGLFTTHLTVFLCNIC